MEPSQLYLVRIWPAGPVFRASVRTADEQEPRWFTAPAELVAFLASTSPAQPRQTPTDRSHRPGANDDEPDHR
ncbi:MAG: hypothetical protein KF683_02065 [Rubrivivax sp.]|nr:hypothetical protein [Rubrivivax sp.]